MSVPPLSDMFSMPIEKSPTFVIPSPINQSQPSSQSPLRSSQNPIVPSTSTSITTKLMNQMKNITVSPSPIPTTNNVTLTSALQASSRPLSTVSYMNEYEIIDINTQPTKKPMATIAAFPPRQSSSLFTSRLNDIINDNILISDDQDFSSISKDEKTNGYERDTPLYDGGIRFGTTPGPQEQLVASAVYVNRYIKELKFSKNFFSIVMMMNRMMNEVDNII
jgi:hypothetical protein